jgi:hypothetical protein
LTHPDILPSSSQQLKQQRLRFVVSPILLLLLLLLLLLEAFFPRVLVVKGRGGWVEEELETSDEGCLGREVVRVVVEGMSGRSRDGGERRGKERKAFQLTIEVRSMEEDTLPFRR